MNRVFLVLLLSCISCSPGYPTEKDHDPAKFVQKMSDLRFAIKEMGFISEDLITRDGVRLQVTRIATEKIPLGSIAILPGYSETWILYVEFFSELLNAGYDVFIMDFRSMGQSQRTGPDPETAHLKGFEEYIGDVSEFVDRFFLPHARGPRYLFGNSMGGLASAYYLSRNKNHPFEKVFFSCPLFGLNVGIFPEWLVAGITEIMCFTGNCDQKIFGRPRVTLEHIRLDDSTVSTSEARMAVYRQAIIDEPRVLLAGPTASWVREIRNATAPERISELAATITIPTFVLQAEHDLFVVNDKQDFFCRKNENCVRHLVKGARHEIFKELDRYRSEGFGELMRFLR